MTASPAQYLSTPSREATHKFPKPPTYRTSSGMVHHGARACRRLLVPIVHSCYTLELHRGIGRQKCWSYSFILDWDKTSAGGNQTSSFFNHPRLCWCTVWGWEKSSETLCECWMTITSSVCWGSGMSSASCLWPRSLWSDSSYLCISGKLKCSFLWFFN